MHDEFKNENLSESPEAPAVAPIPEEPAAPPTPVAEDGTYRWRPEPAPAYVPTPPQKPKRKPTASGS